MVKNGHHYWILLIPVLLLAFWIGAHGLDADALWVDEIWSLYDAGGAYFGPLSPSAIWTRVATEDPWQAPGYSLLLAGWGALAGWTPFAVRGLSLLAGVMAIAWAYRLGHDLVSPLGGLSAAISMGASAYFLYYFHELRSYALVVALTPATIWAYWRLVNRHGGWRTQAVFFLGVLSLMYTHYFGALPIAVIGVYHLLFVKKDRRWWLPVLLVSAAGLLYLPWIAALVSALDLAAADRARQFSAWTPRQIVQGTLFMFSNGGVMVALLLALYSLRRSPVVMFVWFWLLGTLGLILVVNARFGVILEARYLLPLWPALAIVVALALDRLGQTTARRLPLLILGLWLVAGVWNSLDRESAYTLSNPHWHQPMHKLAAALRPRALDADALLYLLPDWTWTPYHEDSFSYYLHDLSVRGTLLERPENLGQDEFVRRAQNGVAGAQRVWSAYTADQPTHYVEEVQQLLADSRYLFCGNFSIEPDLALALYSRLPDANRGTRFDVPGNLSNQTSATGITLNHITNQPVVSQAVRNITGLWSIGAAVPPNTYSVGLHVETPEGQLVAQADYGLPAEAHSCHSADIDLTGLPTGVYHLYAAVYAWQTGERLSIDDAGGDRLEIGSFTITNPDETSNS